MSPRVAAAVVGLLIASAPRAFAGDAECSYFEISATSGKDPAIDAELKQLEKKLKRPPFASWNVFHKLSGGAFSLGKLKVEALALKQGSASVLLRDRKADRIDLTLSVDGPDRKRVLDTKPTMTAGDWLVFGTNPKDEAHILALTCK